jgi:hypothetical protein
VTVRAQVQRYPDSQPAVALPTHSREQVAVQVELFIAVVEGANPPGCQTIEIEKMGRAAAASAKPEASWRTRATPRESVGALQGTPDGNPMLYAEALRLQTWARIVGAGRKV